MKGGLLSGCRTVIYDCDGVMFDSFEANFVFYSKVLERFGLPPLDRSDRETMRLLHTYSSRDVLAVLFRGDPRGGEALEFAATIDYRELLPFMRMEEGLRETLTVLAERFDLAVCTNRSTSMEMLLETFGLDRFFSFVMTASRVANPKPHPEPLLKILEHYGIGPGQAVFVGDSELDFRAAAASGVPFIAYKSDLPAIARIDSHGEILELVGERMKGEERQ